MGGGDGMGIRFLSMKSCGLRSALFFFFFVSPAIPIVHTYVIYLHFRTHTLAVFLSLH